MERLKKRIGALDYKAKDIHGGPVMINKRPSIVDVARTAGVSKSTVSLAMRNSPLLAEKTLKAVQKVARRLGYRPNMLFSVMGSGNRLKRKGPDRLPIAYLHDSPPGTKEIGDFRFLPGIALDYGFSIDPFNLNDFKTALEVEKTLFHRGYSAVIVGRITNRKSIAYDLELADFTVISNTNTLWKENFHRVSGDVFKAVQLAWDKCIEAGFRRIGAAVCRHAPPVPDDDMRLGAVLERQSHHAAKQVAIKPFLGEPGDMEGFASWVRKERPDAVVGFHIGHYYRLKEDFGSGVPAFAGLIIQPGDEWSSSVSGVLYQEREVAEVSISLLDQEIRKRIHGIPEHVMRINLAPRWHEGETLVKVQSRPRNSARPRKVL